MKLFGKGLALSAVALVLCTSVTSADDKSEIKVLLIGKQPDHPWGTHMYLHTCEMLTKCLGQTEGVKAVVSDGWPKDPAQLEGVKTIKFIHGIGNGVLRDKIHKLLSKNDTIQYYEDANKERFGYGATLIHFK